MAEVFLGYVHPGHVTHEFLESLLRLISAQEHSVGLYGEQSGVLISWARNKVAKAFLDSKADYLLIVDTDIYFEPDAVTRLIEDDLPIVSAVYYGRDRGGNQFIVGNDYDPKDSRYNRVKKAKVKRAKAPVQVDGVGMGFCLIKREVMEKLDVRPDELWPYAEIVYEGKQMGEDITFCLRAKELGYDSYIDPQVRVGHLKTVLL